MTEDLRKAYAKADAEYNFLIRALPDVSRRNETDQRRIDEALGRRLEARYAWQAADPSVEII